MKRTVQRLQNARVDTDQPLSFWFDGRPYRGYAGDTLASALLANGVDVVGAACRTGHEVPGAGKEETNALVQLESGAYTEPNARATLVPLAGLRARGQNAWPNVADLFALMGAFVLPASFITTFMWPNWHTWEWLVRRIAGLGTAPEGPDPQTYIKQNVHADLVVIGAGRSGLQAALEAAADAECRVLLIDEQEEPGGALLASPSEADIQWLRDTLERIAAQKNITLLSRTTVNGYYDNNVLAALERVTNHLGPLTDDQPRERFWRIFAGRVVLATGALERPMVFPNNDRPGIMLDLRWRNIPIAMA